MLDAAALVLAFYTYLLGYQLYGSSNLTVLTIDNTIIQAVTTIAVISYVLSTLWQNIKHTKRIGTIKLSLLVCIITATTILSTANLIYLRRHSEPHHYIHDHPLQIELALQFLLEGKNPYTENYQETPLPKWSSWPTNPAVYHFISLPSALYLALPVFVAWKSLFGWFDHRIVNILFFAIASASACTLLRKQEHRVLAILAFGMNPLFTPHFIMGLDDIVFLGTILLSLALLSKKKVSLSLITLAIAVTTKHTAWFIVPFYFYHLHQKGLPWKKTAKLCLAFACTSATLLLPFIVWNARAFFEDIYSYPAGTIPTGYPVQGFGIVPLLVSKGIINAQLT